MPKGRPKANKFEPDEASYYFSRRKTITTYLGNEISGIHDKNIDSRTKLQAEIVGFLLKDVETLFKDYALFGNLPNGNSVFLDIATNDEVRNYNNDIFAIVSNITETPSGKKVYAIFYVPWRDSEIIELRDSIRDITEEKVVDNDATDNIKWMLSFFKRHAKTIPANEKEIKKLKEIIRYVS